MRTQNVMIVMSCTYLFPDDRRSTDGWMNICSCVDVAARRHTIVFFFVASFNVRPRLRRFNIGFFFPCATLLRHKDDHRRSISRPHAFKRQRKTSLWQVHRSCLCLKGSDRHSHSHEDTTRRLCRAAYHERVRRVTSRKTTKNTSDLCGGGGGSHRSRDQCVRVARQIHDETRRDTRGPCHGKERAQEEGREGQLEQTL